MPSSRLSTLAIAATLLPSISGSAQPAPKLFGEGTVTTAENEFGPAFTPDGATLYFCRTAPGRGNYQAILVSRLSGGSWAAPDVAEFSGEWKDIDPSISPDGKRLVFASNRPIEGSVARKDYDLFALERVGAAWSAPKHLGARVNSEASETTTSIAADGTLYIASERPGGKGRRDLYRARLVDGAYGEPEPLEGLNTPFDDSNQFIAPDQSYLLFASDRAGGPSRLYVSYQRDGTWTPPEALPEAIAGPAGILTPVVTPDGRKLVFASFRSFSDAPLGRRLSLKEMTERFRAPGNGLGDLYSVDVTALGLKPAK